MDKERLEKILPKKKKVIGRDPYCTTDAQNSSYNQAIDDCLNALKKSKRRIR